MTPTTIDLTEIPRSGESSHLIMLPCLMSWSFYRGISCLHSLTILHSWLSFPIIISVTVTLFSYTLFCCPTSPTVLSMPPYFLPAASFPVSLYLGISQRRSNTRAAIRPRVEFRNCNLSPDVISLVCYLFCMLYQGCLCWRESIYCSTFVGEKFLASLIYWCLAPT